MKTYAEYTKQLQEKMNHLPYIKFAFGDYQTQAVFNSWGLTYPDDLDKVTTIYGAGDIIQKKDVEAFHQWYEEISKPLDDEFQELIKNDDFVIDMFIYELGNHEYQYSLDDTTVINACGFSMAEFNQDDRLTRLYKIATRKFFALCDENDWW